MLRQLLIPLLVLLHLASVTQAAEKKFDGSTSSADPATGGGTSWFTGSANRWRADGFPGTGDHIVLDDSIIQLPSDMSVSAIRTVQSVTINSTSFDTLETNNSGLTAQQLGLNGAGGINPILFDLQSAGGGQLSVGANGVLTIVPNVDGQFSVASGMTLALSSNALISASTRTIDKSGGGTLSLQRSDNTANMTIISGGTLLLGSSGSITGSVNVKSGANFNVSSIGSGFTISAGRTLSGTGTVTGKSIIQGTVSPGNSIGSMSVGSEDWAPGGQYTWEVNATTGAAGTNWDFLNVGGTLDITATLGTPFKIKLVSLNGSGNPAPLGGVGPNQNYSWTIATASSVTNFASSKFSFDTTDFSAAYGGTWAIQESSNSISLVYSSVPEPTAAAALLALPLILSRRTRARRAGRITA